MSYIVPNPAPVDLDATPAIYAFVNGALPLLDHTLKRRKRALDRAQARYDEALEMVKGRETLVDALNKVGTVSVRP